MSRTNISTEVQKPVSNEQDDNPHCQQNPCAKTEGDDYAPKPTAAKGNDLAADEIPLPKPSACDFTKTTVTNNAPTSHLFGMPQICLMTPATTNTEQRSDHHHAHDHGACSIKYFYPPYQVFG